MLMRIPQLGLFGAQPGTEKRNALFVCANMISTSASGNREPAQHSKAETQADRKNKRGCKKQKRRHPPLSRGMNSVSSAVGSKLLRISLFPSLNRLAAVKPAPVSILKRASACATAAASAGS